MDIPSWLTSGIHTYGYWIVLIAVALESMGVPFPGETALLAGAVFAGTGHLNIALVILAAALGAILGDNLGYAIGYRGGYPLLQRLGRLLHVDLRGLSYTERFFQQHGDKTVFLGRFFSVVRTYVALFAGINRMPWRTFLIFNALGGITWATVFGLLGYFLGKNTALLGTVLNTIGIGGIVLLVAFVVGVVGYLLVKRRRARRKLLEQADVDYLPGESNAPGPLEH
jgi:membrane protein DedA with SNARE-associated domain